MFAVSTDGQAYACDSFKAFANAETRSCVALYTIAPVPGVRNMFMRFYPNSLRDTSNEKKLVYNVPNVKIPKTKYTLSLSSEKDIPVFLRRVFEIMTYQDSNLPGNLPSSISDLLYVENLPGLVSDIQRFMYENHLEETLQLLDIQIEKPSGCSLYNPFTPEGLRTRPTEKIGSFYRFIPVYLDYTSVKGFGYIVQEDMYQYIRNLEGNWSIQLHIVNNSESEKQKDLLDREEYDVIEFNGWTCNHDFWDICYYLSITSNILNKLNPLEFCYTTGSFIEYLPGLGDPAHYSRINFSYNSLSESVDTCFDAFISLKTARLIQ